MDKWFLAIKKIVAETQGEEVSWTGGNTQVLPPQEMPFTPFYLMAFKGFLVAFSKNMYV